MGFIILLSLRTVPRNLKFLTEKGVGRFKEFASVMNLKIYSMEIITLVWKSLLENEKWLYSRKYLCIQEKSEI